MAADAVACRARGGPLAEERVAADDGLEYHLHPRDPATGAAYDPVPVEVGQFIGTVFDPADVVLVRPIETWAEDGRKRSRVVYPAVACPTAGGLATDFRRWAGLQRVAAAERANLFFSVCPRFGPDDYDLSWLALTVRWLRTNQDACNIPEHTIIAILIHCH